MAITLVYYAIVIRNLYEFWTLYCFKRQLDALLEMKKVHEYNCLQGKMRNDMVMFTSKGCCGGIFDHKMRDREVAKFTVTNSGTTKIVGNMDFEKDKINFILTGEIEPNHEYNCAETTLNILQFADKDVIGNYLMIMKFIKEQGFNDLEYDCIRYKMERIGECEYTDFSLGNAFRRVETKYNGENQTMIDLDEMFGTILFSFSERQEYTTKAVDLVLEYLHKKGILRQQVDLLEYPDLLQIIIPFDLAFRKSKRWDLIEQKMFGFDLRDVEKSDLAFLFDLKIVREYLKTGGVYVTSEIIRHG
ncbi:hypothetical protein ECANGB1_2033 [Enterospora canceri]|uniref:Uncharacterized protein n=1 Tax=Enterospora canceri TaxID=1081671 RepID=A0A1Y1S536_9MICR|nr:hypothetical protein ECANGB1_2033 [Enterospora canceri]